MKSVIRFAVMSLLFGAVLVIGVNGALAQTYPSKSVRLVVPYPPGGGPDVISRIIMQKVAENWGQPVVIDNRAGASTMLGAEMVAKSAPDGYTLLCSGATTFIINPLMQSKIAYHPVKDFAPITLAGWMPYILVVNSSLPVKSVQELIALAKSKPGVLNCGTAGPATTSQLALDLFKSMTGVDIVHVPYKGLAPGVMDLLAGRISMMFVDQVESLAHVKEGKLRALGTCTLKRSSVLPDIPSIAEAGLPGFETAPWLGYFASGQTPKQIIDKLNTEIVKVLNTPDIRKRLATAGMEPVGSTPEQLAAHIATETTKWAKVVKRSDAKVD